jgi:hypothetical protein
VTFWHRLRLAAKCPTRDLPVHGTAGDPDDIHGGEVDKYFRDGRIREIAEYAAAIGTKNHSTRLRLPADRGQLPTLEQLVNLHIGPDGFAVIAGENRDGRIHVRQVSLGLRKPRLVVVNRAS